jgi:hypothetical protein
MRCSLNQVTEFVCSHCSVQFLCALLQVMCVDNIVLEFLVLDIVCAIPCVYKRTFSISATLHL